MQIVSGDFYFVDSKMTGKKKKDKQAYKNGSNHHVKQKILKQTRNMSAYIMRKYLTRSPDAGTLFAGSAVPAGFGRIIKPFLK